MKTIFGVEWPIPDIIGISLTLLFLLLILGFYLLFRYNQSLQSKKSQAQQLFLFKTRQLGLSNFQVRMLNGIVDTLRLADPMKIMEGPELFESAIGSFLTLLSEKHEKGESLAPICQDLIITYEKLYHPTAFRRPLERISDIEDRQLLYLTTRDETVFIGKLIKKEDSRFVLQVFRSPQRIVTIREGEPLTVFLWRAGDAEYTFNSKLLAVGPNTVEIEVPQEFDRGKEVRHPFVDVIIPCIITELIAAQEGQREEQRTPVEMNGIIYKLHADELIMRIPRKLDYNKTYVISFTLADFKMRITAIIIAERTIHEENVYYNTFRFIEISDAAKAILKKYISEHL